MPIAPCLFSVLLKRRLCWQTSLGYGKCKDSGASYDPAPSLFRMPQKTSISCGESRISEASLPPAPSLFRVPLKDEHQLW